MVGTASDRLIYVVDDDEAFRDSLRFLLESAGYRPALFANVERFLDSYHAGRGACLLLDVRMPGLSGLELQAELNRRGDGLPVIFLTGHGDVPMAVETVKKGAFYFLEKPFNDRALLSLIEEAIVMDSTALRERGRKLCAIARLAALTHREREVLELVVIGRKNKQIADELGISVKTVEAHRARGMEKAGASSVAELVQIAYSSR